VMVARWLASTSTTAIPPHLRTFALMPITRVYSTMGVLAAASRPRPATAQAKALSGIGGVDGTVREGLCNKSSRSKPESRLIKSD
jgi:hypothetical protein